MDGGEEAGTFDGTGQLVVVSADDCHARSWGFVAAQQIHHALSKKARASQLTKIKRTLTFLLLVMTSTLVDQCCWVVAHRRLDAGRVLPVELSERVRAMRQNLSFSSVVLRNMDAFVVWLGRLPVPEGEEPSDAECLLRVMGQEGSCRVVYSEKMTATSFCVARFPCTLAFNFRDTCLAGKLLGDVDFRTLIGLADACKRYDHLRITPLSQNTIWTLRSASTPTLQDVHYFSSRSAVALPRTDLLITDEDAFPIDTVVLMTLLHLCEALQVTEILFRVEKRGDDAVLLVAPASRWSLSFRSVISQRAASPSFVPRSYRLALGTCLLLFAPSPRVPNPRFTVFILVGSLIQVRLHLPDEAIVDHFVESIPEPPTFRPNRSALQAHLLDSTPIK